MNHGDKKQTSEESKVLVFCKSKYKVGADHTAWNLAYAQDIARQVGLGEGEISESAVHHLMSNVTQVVRDVLMTATHYCTHGRRTKVEVLDLENAINVLRPLFSFTCSRAASNTQFISDVLTRSLYENNRYVVDLRSIMNMPPRRMPFKRKIRKHWLVIDGEQPRVPENPVIPLLTSNSTQEGLTTYQNSSTDPLMDDGNRVLRAGNKLEQSVSRPITTHSLSLDQQVFFKKCVETVMGSCSEKRREVLHLLSSDPGLQSLVPRFALIIFEGVRCNISEQNLPILRNILRLVKTLIENPQVNIDKCLNDIIPALCSCVVCREFSADPEDKRHFRLREFAGMILSSICKRTHLADVRARVTTFLCRVFTDSRANLGSLYGALYALGELGCETVAVVVFPRLELLRRRIAILSDSPPTALGDSDKVIRLIEKMLTRFVMRRKMSGLSELCDFQKAFPGFGEAVYNKLKTSGHLQDVVPSVDDVCQSSSTDSGFVSRSSKTQNTPQKQNPRILQLPLRVPGQIRPTNVSAAKLPTFKSNKRHAGGGLFRQAPPTSAPRVTQSTSETVQPLGGSQTLQQHPNIIPQNSRGPSTNPTGPLPAVVVEPAFPRRRPHTLGEQARTHPAVTVEPAYPRRPGQPGAL